MKMTTTRALSLLTKVEPLLRRAADGARVGRERVGTSFTDADARAAQAIAEAVQEDVAEVARLVDEWRVATPKNHEYDCRDCGACCVAPSGARIVAAVTPEDLVRLEPEDVTRLTTDADGNPGTSAMTNGQGLTVCAFLTGNVGGEASCSIYERRPARCRDLANGRCSCRVERQRSGLTVIGDCYEHDEPDCS